MGLVTIDRIKAKQVFYFIICEDYLSALRIGEHLAQLVGNEFVNVMEFKSRDELMMYCDSKILR